MTETNFNKKGDQKKKESFADKAGDAIEKLGDKVAQKGAPAIGKKIHDLGDKLETHHSKPKPKASVENTQSPDKTVLP